MNISEKEFSHFVPVASSPEFYGVFGMVQTELTQAVEYVKDMLGPVAEVAESGENGYDHKAYAILMKSKRVACLEAFYNAIPSLDLVLTPTGFGIVSNQNVAPASADRVERLRRQIRDSADDATDSLLCSLRAFGEWAEGRGREFFNSLFNTGFDVEALGEPNAKRSRLVLLRPKIANAERKLRVLYSPALFAAMADAIRLHREHDYADLIALSRAFVAACVAADFKAIVAARNEILQLLHSDLEAFPEYANSPNYRANTARGYKNQKDDTCFFF